MKLVRTISQVRTAVRAARKAGKTVGLVPTMGAFHKGHLSLIRSAAKEKDFAVVSVFVNPTQFGPSEDYDKYPRDLDRDADLAAKEGADLLFAPSVEEMYPGEPSTTVTERVLARRLEGQLRPGHFDGVCTVCCKLFCIVLPDAAYFGQKDFQQTRVVTRMTRDLNLPLEIRVCPTVREEDGLAMSSRNAYLSPKDRLSARCLWKALTTAQKAFERGVRDGEKLRQGMRKVILAEPGAEVDYVSIAHPDTLVELRRIDRAAVGLLAVQVGATRLIDNVLLQDATSDNGR